jgi:hypothetical protein
MVPTPVARYSLDVHISLGFEKGISQILAPVPELWHGASYPTEGDAMSRREFMKRGIAGIVAALLLLVAGVDDDGGGY